MRKTIPRCKVFENICLVIVDHHKKN